MRCDLVPVLSNYDSITNRYIELTTLRVSSMFYRKCQTMSGSFHVSYVDPDKANTDAEGGKAKMINYTRRKRAS